MKHLDLFSGIGGFALAARWAGFETVAFCEIEEYPRRVLAKNFPGVPIHRDIRDLDGSDYAGTTLITGGYPCQPFSLAGKRGGEKDDRHLWPEMLRIIKQARPTWVVAENVPGHIAMGLDQVLSDLEGEGYAGRPIVVPACAVDAPHRRDRLWIVAHGAGLGRGTRRAGRPDTGCEGQPEQALQDVADATGSRLNAGENGAVRQARDETRLREPQRQGERRGKEQWGTEPDVGRVAHGIPRRVDRLRGLGNAIVPQVAYEILRHLPAT